MICSRWSNVIRNIWKTNSRTWTLTKKSYRMNRWWCFRLWRTQIVDDRYSLVTAPFDRRVYGRVYAFLWEYQYGRCDRHFFSFFPSISTSRNYRILLTINEREKKYRLLLQALQYTQHGLLTQANLLSISIDNNSIDQSFSVLVLSSFAFFLSSIYHSTVVIASCLIVSYRKK